MSNTIKIKHGGSVPDTTQLGEFELGYASIDKGLYINDGTQVQKLNDTSSLETKIKTLDEKVDNVVSTITGIVVGTDQPENELVLWIDTNVDSHGDSTGVAKYYDETSGAWTEVAATWG